MTDYKDFILYQNGKKVLDVAILDENFELIESGIERFYRLVQQFLSVSTPEIKSVKELAKFLAKRVRILRNIVFEKNDKTILLGILEDVWNYKIGGYQVIEKYLKDRKGRELSLDELEHLYRVVEIIKRTIELVKELEKIDPKIERQKIITYQSVARPSSRFSQG